MTPQCKEGREKEREREGGRDKWVRQDGEGVKGEMWLRKCVDLM